MSRPTNFQGGGGISSIWRDQNPSLEKEPFTWNIMLNEEKVYFFSNQVWLRQSKILLENKRRSERDHALDYQEITWGLETDVVQDTVNSGYTHSI